MRYLPAVPTPGPPRKEDLPLHDDVRWLAGALGRVIRRLEGEEAFQIVEQLRVATRARRHGDSDAASLEDLLRQIDRFTIAHCAMASRAFTLFFLLINTAEQTHRVRRRNAYLGRAKTDPQPASARWTMRQLRELGVAGMDVVREDAALGARPQARHRLRQREFARELHGDVAEEKVEDPGEHGLDACTGAEDAYRGRPGGLWRDRLLPARRRLPARSHHHSVE